jgi:hypothetical protein
MSNIKRRQFLTKAGVCRRSSRNSARRTAGVAQEPIRWRMQTYAGARWASM